MGAARDAFEVQIGGRSVVMALLTCNEVLIAAQAAEGDDAPAVLRQAAMLSLREVDGEAVDYEDLQQTFAQRFPKVREVAGLVRAYAQLHEPTEAERAAVRASVEIEEGADGEERWTARLPDGRAVTLQAGSFDTLREVLRSAGRVRSQSAQQWSGLIEGCRRSLVAIDGAPVSIGGARAWGERFGVKDTQLIGMLWSELHQPAEVTLGEARPAPGTTSRTSPATATSR